jgi:serine/threonine-protein kinase
LRASLVRAYDLLMHRARVLAAALLFLPACVSGKGGVSTNDAGAGGGAGTTGAAGAGVTGDAGASGGAGTTGAAGGAGATATAGTSGGAGTTGAAGAAGAAGTTGKAGSSGGAGSTGKAGSTGTAGAAGAGAAGTGAAGTGAGGAGGTGAPAPSSCRRPLLPANAPWNQRADALPVDASSAAIIGALQTHGWGAGHMQIDRSIHVMCDPDGTAPKMTFTPTKDSYNPDCDLAPVPIPKGGHIEGEAGYNCTHNGDCHLIVIAPMEHRLYEQWRVDFTSGAYRGGCLAIWDTSTTPPASGRGDGCTSADAGGFPMAAMLFDADEVAAGHIDHAIRFILPNEIIENDTFVHPATHATQHTSLPNAVPYGAHLRLRSDRLAAVLAALPNAAARVVAQTLHDYGMYLSDGGNIALTSEDDQNTKAKWSNVMGTGLGTTDLQTIQPSDFEMVDGGMRHVGASCNRTPLTK